MIDKTSLEFGTGSFVGDVMSDPEFFEGDIRDQALAVGWADGCPVALNLTDPTNPSVGRGPDSMLGRYGEVNFWFGQIIRDVKEINPQLAAQLMMDVDRKAGEPAGRYEEDSVPDEYTAKMSPMNTLTGYALPRIFVDYLHGAPGTLDGANLEQSTAERMTKALDLLGEVAEAATDPLDLLVRFTAEGEERIGLDGYRALYHMLGKGWLDEHNSMSTLSELKDRLQGSESHLGVLYSALTDEGRDKIGIV